MTLSEYHAHMLRTWKPNRGRNHLMGLMGEAGEVCDLVKKDVYHQRKPNPDDVCKELGDCLWYLAAVLADRGDDLELLVLSPFGTGVTFSDIHTCWGTLTRLTLEQCGLRLPILAAQAASTVLDAGRGFTRTHAETLRFYLEGYFTTLYRLAGHYNLTLEQVAVANVEKLQKRYPNGMVPGGGIREAEAPRQTYERVDVGSDIPGGGAA